MSERRSSVLVGAFVVATLVIGIAAGLFFAGGGLGVERSRVVMAFDGSLRGLTVGAPIALRGVTIGQVTDIDLILDADRGDLTMVVEGEIDPSSMQLVGDVTESIHNELVARGLRARLETQSFLTGLLYVQLDFFPEKEAKMEALNSPYPQLPTIPTELEELRQSLQSFDYAAIAEDFNRIATGLDRLLNNPDLQELPSAVRESLASIESASSSLDALLQESTPRLSAFLDEGNQTLVSLNEALPDISQSLSTSLASLDAALGSANATLIRLEKAAAPDSAPRRQLAQAMHELSLAARSLRSLARSFEEHPEALLRGRGDESP